MNEEQVFDILKTMSKLWELYMTDPAVRKKVKAMQTVTTTTYVSAQPQKTPETKNEGVDISGFFDQSWK